MAALSIPIRLDAALVAKIDYLAKQQRRSRSQMLRVFIEDGLAAHEAQHGPIATPSDGRGLG